MLLRNKPSKHQMETSRPVIVVTGFGPFGIHLKNASWEAVSLLPHMNLEEECNITLITKEIPVAYDEVNHIVPDLWQQYNPVLMVHAGVSHVAKEVTLESCANKSGYCGVDVKKCKLLDGVHCLGEEEHVKTNIDLELIRSEAKQFSVSLDISDDARRYLCEYIYYTSLSIDCHKTIFLHVPMVTKDYSALKIAEHIKLIIKLALKQLRQL